MTQPLQKTLDLATAAHGEQTRKYSNDLYITHPIRVANQVKEEGGSECQIAAALLHDVIEDTEVTVEQLRVALHNIWSSQEAEQILKMVIELTDVFVKKDFPLLNRKARKLLEARRLGGISKEAKQIKFADIKDNQDSIGLNPDFAKVWNQEKEVILSYLRGQL
jgi:(p)ppGpp synthase/HD superfamily hydrolase